MAFLLEQQYIMENINLNDKKYEKIIRYLLEKRYTEEECWMLIGYLEGIIHPVFEEYLKNVLLYK